MADLGNAYVQILPSMKGIEGNLTSTLSGVASAAGSLAGSSFGGMFISGLTSIGNLGSSVLKSAANAVVDFGKSAVSAGAEFDTAMSQVAATMGYTVDDLNDSTSEASQNMATLRDFARDMGSTTAFSATEAAEALNYMALAGYDAETSMEMLPNVLNLASAGTMELATASDMLTDTQTAFGITIERTTELVDEMAKAASTGNTNVEQLGDAFLTVGGLAQELNGGLVELDDGTVATVDGINELEIALTAMANAGIKGSEAGTHMRNMILKLSDPTDAGTQALEKMGVAIYDDEGKMNSLTDIFSSLNDELSEMTQQEKITTISDLFNTRDIASAESLLNAVTGEYVKFEDQIYSVDEAYEQWGDDIYDSAKGFEYVKTSWDDIGESILNSSYDLEAVKTALGNSSIDWSNYTDNAKQLWTDLVTDVDYSMNSLEMTVGELQEHLQMEYGLDADDAFQTIELIQTAFEESTGAAAEMAGTQLDNLEGDVTKLKSAYGDLQISISDALTPTLREFVQFATDGIGQIDDAIKSGDMDSVATTIGDLLSQGIEKINSVLPDLVTSGTQIVKSLLQGLTQNTGDVTTGITSIITTITTGINDVLPDLLNVGLQILSGIISGIGQALPDLIPATISMITEIGNVIVDNFDLLADSAILLLDAVVAGIIDNIDVLVDAGVEIVTKLVDALLTKSDTLIEAGLDLAIKIIDGIDQELPHYKEKGQELISKLTQAINDNLPDILETGIAMLTELTAGLIEYLPEFKEEINNIGLTATIALLEEIDWISVGKSIIQGIANGVLKSDALSTNLLSVAKNAYDAACNYLDINSPSKLFRDNVGAAIPEGMAVGIEKNEGYVTKAMNDLSGTTVDSMDYNNITAAATYDGYAAGDFATSDGLDGARVSLPIEIDLGDTKLKEIIYEYMITKTDNNTTALRLAQGGAY